jgi:hypothetical protein
MKISFLAVCGALFLGIAAAASAEPLIQPNDRVAFCGDGMTETTYPGFMEEYLLSCQSNIAGLDLKQFGWSAETPGAFLARLDKDLLPYKPTVVTLPYNFGDNGSDKPLDAAAVTARDNAEKQLIDALKIAGVRAIVLGSPPCVDSTLYHHDPAQATAFNAKLAQVSVDSEMQAPHPLAAVRFHPSVPPLKSPPPVFWWARNGTVRFKRVRLDYLYDGGDSPLKMVSA